MSNKILKPNWPNSNNIVAFTTLKGCDLTTLKLPKKQFFINQEHGTNILRADSSNYVKKSNIMLPIIGDRNYKKDIPTADGSYTKAKNLACIIKTADCLPILISNLTGTFVAAIHAGWRGLAQGIIDNFFKKIINLNLNWQDLIFWLGPAISQKAFIVEEEVIIKFSSYSNAIHNIPNTNKYLVNLYLIARMNLYKFNINDNQIFSENFCTYSQNDLFYSYRKNPNDPGRMYSMIWIK